MKKNEAKNRGAEGAAAKSPARREQILRIVPVAPSQSGLTLVQGTQVLMPDGTPIPYVTDITLSAHLNDVWRAQITCLVRPPEISCMASVELEFHLSPLQQFAHAHRVVLVSALLMVAFICAALGWPLFGCLPAAIAAGVFCGGAAVTALVLSDRVAFGADCPYLERLRRSE